MNCYLCNKDIGSRIMYIPREDKNTERAICSSCYYEVEHMLFPSYRQICLSEEEYNKINDI